MAIGVMTPHSSDRIALGDPANSNPSIEIAEFLYKAPSEEPVIPPATSPPKSSSMSAKHSAGTFDETYHLVLEPKRSNIQFMVWIQ